VFAARVVEAFDSGIGIAIALAAPRYLEAVLAQELLVVVGTILRPAIRRMRAAWWGPLDRDGPVQVVHAVADRLPDTAP